MARPTRKKAADKGKSAREKATEGSGILMPHVNHQFRVVFDDSPGALKGLTQQVNSVDVDFFNNKLTVTLRDVLFDTILSQVNEFTKTIGNIEVRYMSGSDGNFHKGVRFYGKTTGLSTSYSYASETTGITMITLEYEFNDFNEYFPDEN